MSARNNNENQDRIFGLYAHTFIKGTSLTLLFKRTSDFLWFIRTTQNGTTIFFSKKNPHYEL